MKIKYLLALALLSCFTSCIQKDPAKTLRYSYSESDEVGIQNIRFEDLSNMKSGTACSYKMFYILPIGSNSIINAAKNGGVNNIVYIAKGGFWTFPFSKDCNIVYGS